LRIYTTINSKMQQYAEQAMAEHMKELQKKFNEHLKGQEPWKEHPEIMQQGRARSERYAVMKGAGISAHDIDKVFNKKIPMQVFSWKGPIDTVLSPNDSIRYY
jgi:penicillin-binding protein 1A